MLLQTLRFLLTGFALDDTPKAVWSASSYRSDVAIISREFAHEIE